MVCLLVENLKGVIKDHQKKFEVKTPKINPIFDDFSEGTETSFNFLLISYNNFLMHEKQKSIGDT